MPNYVIPDLYVEGIWALNSDDLIRRGINNCIVDVNQTLIAYNHKHPPEKVIEVIHIMQEHFQMCALSNYIGNAIEDKQNERAMAIESELNMPVIRSGSKKPSLSAYENALKYMGARSFDTCFIGDRIFTDTIGAKRAGLFTVLVDPIDINEDPLFVKIPRCIERVILRIMSIVARLTGITYG